MSRWPRGAREATEADAADLRRTVMLAGLSAMCFGVFLWGIAPASESGVFWA